MAAKMAETERWQRAMAETEGHVHNMRCDMCKVQDAMVNMCNGAMVQECRCAYVQVHDKHFVLHVKQHMYICVGCATLYICAYVYICICTCIHE